MLTKNRSALVRNLKVPLCLSTSTSLPSGSNLVGVADTGVLDESIIGVQRVQWPFLKRLAYSRIGVMSLPEGPIPATS